MRSSSPALALLTALIVAASLAACGGGGDDESAVRAAVAEFVEAGNGNDFATVCELLSEDQRRAVATGDSCAGALRQQASGREGDTQIRIDEVRISGDRASVDATVIGADGARQPETLLLVDEDGGWKIASAGG